MYQLPIDIIFLFFMYYLIVKNIKADLEQQGVKISYKLAMKIFLIIYLPFFSIIFILYILKKFDIVVSEYIRIMLYVVALFASGMISYIAYKKFLNGFKRDHMKSSKENLKSLK
ncbi:MAG: hypothetical protein HZY31_04145 [Methanocaldococcus sp.]|nr:hypothetical protein [Methanocaldococcus sp.]